MIYQAKQEINHNEYQEILGTRWHNDLFPRFNCLHASYILVVAIHPLVGSRANRHHTPNPQSGVAQPTQDGDPQAMSNPLEYLLALHRGKVKNPSQSPRSELETITNLRSTILAAPSHLGGSESASSPLVGFGWLNDNVIKDLTRLLSVNRK